MSPSASAIASRRELALPTRAPCAPRGRLPRAETTRSRPAAGAASGSRRFSSRGRAARRRRAARRASRCGSRARGPSTASPARRPGRAGAPRAAARPTRAPRSRPRRRARPRPPPPPGSRAASFGRRDARGVLPFRHHVEELRAPPAQRQTSGPPGVIGSGSRSRHRRSAPARARPYRWATPSRRVARVRERAEEQVEALLRAARRRGSRRGSARCRSRRAGARSRRAVPRGRAGERTARGPAAAPGVGQRAMKRSRGKNRSSGVRREKSATTGSETSGGAAPGIADARLETSSAASKRPGAAGEWRGRPCRCPRGRRQALFGQAPIRRLDGAAVDAERGRDLARRGEARRLAERGPSRCARRAPRRAAGRAARGRPGRARSRPGRSNWPAIAPIVLAKLRAQGISLIADGDLVIAHSDLDVNRGVSDKLLIRIYV